MMGHLAVGGKIAGVHCIDFFLVLDYIANLRAKDVHSCDST